VSTFYKTVPVERPEQPSFINGVVEIETDIAPKELKHSILRGIESELGRNRTDDKYAARTIDLDILLYDDLVTETDDLQIPDPDIRQRPFVAVPLFELDPDLILPDSGTPINRVVDSLAGHNMQPMKEFSESIRRDLMDEHREG
jgi:dihydroneopterin aldolase/2-amino-4-hydroxy-6-hydroxymethyldihydropteridine diphosphokinase